MRAGDRVAAAQFMNAYSPLIRVRVRDKLAPWLRRVLDSEDVLSTVGRRLDGLVFEGKLRAETEPELWSLVQSIARNAISEVVRTSNPHVPMTDPPCLGGMEYARQTPSDAQSDFVVRAMASLEDETDRSVLWMWLQGARHMHIAKAIGSSPAAVRMRWMRLCRTLRTLTTKDAA